MTSEVAVCDIDTATKFKSIHQLNQFTLAPVAPSHQDFRKFDGWSLPWYFLGLNPDVSQDATPWLMVMYGVLRSPSPQHLDSESFLGHLSVIGVL